MCELRPKFETGGRSISFACVTGSHNYNLHGADSDIDFKCLVFPTFDDVYGRAMFSTAFRSDTHDYTVHDVRKIPTQLWKSNISFIEILFSQKILYFCHPWPYILERKDACARMNLPYLYESCHGMWHTKFINLEKGTEGTQHLVERYGYDTKQALHCFRALDFLERYYKTRFFDFGKSIWYDFGVDRDFILGIKNGSHTLEQFKDMVLEKESKVKLLKDAYYAGKPDKNLYNVLEDMIKIHVRNEIVEERK